MKRLEGKTAIVSGSGRGIGRAIAIKLAGEGANVVVNDIDDEPAGKVLSEIESAGGTAVACLGDVTQPDFGDRFVSTAIDSFGGLDIIINNAGYTWDNVIQKMSDDQFQAMLDIHAVAPFRILRAAIGPIREFTAAEAKQGREVFRKVVNVSSIVALTGNPGQVNYSAGKAALIGMTKTLAKEWGRYKVNVNSVGFGMIETRIAQPVDGEKPKAKIGEREIELGIPSAIHQTITMMIPLGRWGTPEEAAGAAFLFCIPESDFITGQVLMASGGM